MSATFSGVREAVGRHLAQERAQALHAGLGHHALLLELRLRQVAARFLDDLAARDLELEGALQAEHEVEEVDRLGVQPLDERHVELDVLDVAAERIGDGLGDRRERRRGLRPGWVDLASSCFTPS